MDTIQQNHMGEGDNVAGDKIINIVKSLAPSDLTESIEAVFEKLRQNEISAAKIQIEILKSIARKDPETTSLVEVLAIMNGLNEKQDNDASWTAVVKSISYKSDPVLIDICLAALLKLAYGTDREDGAKEFYNNNKTGVYAKEFYFRYYAGEEELLAALEICLQEETLTGITLGAQRLQLAEISLKAARKLNLMHPTYNSKVLLAIAMSLDFNSYIATCHIWLHKPSVKKKIDGLRDLIISLLEESGRDRRVHELGCATLNIYQGCDSERLYEALKENVQHMNSSHLEDIARSKILIGDSSLLNEDEQSVKEAYKDPHKRSAWCNQFIDTSPHSPKEALIFLDLASSLQIKKWLTREKHLIDASDIEKACIDLIADIFQHTRANFNYFTKKEVSEKLHEFLARWQSKLSKINLYIILKVAYRLIYIKMPYEAFELLRTLVPNHELWASPYVILYMRSLQESGRYNTFDKTIKRIEGADQNFELLYLQSYQAEKMYDIDSALSACNAMIELAPESLLSWHRTCYLLYHYRSLEEQQSFHLRIPDSILLHPYHEVKSILFFISYAGDFTRAETRWVDWMINDPQSHAVDLVDFYTGLLFLGKMPEKVSPSLEQCDRGIQYCCEGEPIVQLIVNESNNRNEYILVKSNKVAQFLISLSPGKTERLDMRRYKLEKNIPPFIACLNIATKLRQRINDGNDHFVTLQVPSDPNEIVSFFKEIMAPSEEHRQCVQSDSNRSLYFRGHALYPSEPFKAAINFWSDPNVPKSQLMDIGAADPSIVVLDAYSIGYIAKTSLVNHLLDRGVVLVAPHSTKTMLKSFLITVTDEDYFSIGVNDAGNLYRTTVIDVQTHEANTIDALQLILDNLTVVQPKIIDEDIVIRGIKDYVDDTVYDAIQLSTANNIPWFCMDRDIGMILHNNNHVLVNVQDFFLQVMNERPFNFSQRCHSLALYAYGALPLPVTFHDICCVASTSDTLAGFILFKIVINHGKEVFYSENRLNFLLKIICTHHVAMFGMKKSRILSKYSPYTNYMPHFFNHGLNLYIESFEGKNFEFRLAVAMNYMLHILLDISPLAVCPNNTLWLGIFKRFFDFSRGHFLDWDITIKYFRLLIDGKDIDNEQ